MTYTNHAMLIRRELMARIGKLLFDGELIEKIDRIPIEMRPRKGYSSRCCIYKDRAVLKYRMMAMLGFNVQDETDELTPLSEYARRALDRNEISSTILTVVDEACSACVKVNYEVTNLCRGCVGRPCILNCPKESIFIKEGKASIDHSTCINCGKCQKACPYHAIIYQPIPCEEACPVGAISKNPDGVEFINETKCIHCGKCVTACPFGAVIEKTHLVEVLQAILSDKKVIALPAPSIIGQFKADYSKILGALIKLGFSDIIEVAAGASLTAQHEAEEFAEKMHKGKTFMTTSCCPAYVQAVDKHLPDLKPYVSSTPSPMSFAARLAKEKHPESVVVFIGPCVAKRSEAFYDPNVDLTLSFEELGSLFVAKGINVAKEEDYFPDGQINKTSHGFGAITGVTQALQVYLPKEVDLKNMVIDGIDKTTIRLMKGFSKQCEGNFIEVMTCEGGCVAGPNVLSNPKIAAKQLNDYVTNL